MGVILPYSSLVILILLIWIVQMSGLNIYSYVEDADVQFYRTQKSLAKRMDILDWIPRSYVDEIVQGARIRLIWRGESTRMNLPCGPRSIARTAHRIASGQSVRGSRWRGWGGGGGRGREEEE